MSKSRQLAAIMFTDIVGFTALMGSDEQKTLEILEMNRQIHKPIITAYNGRWIKELGDGVMATFTNISDAVSAATKIMKACNAANEYQLCIGIHSAEVVFEHDDVFGDGVNIAARIQSAAPAGCIFISETVQNSIANKTGIQTNFYKEVKLKNVNQPIRLHQVLIEGSEIALAVVSPSDNKSIAVLPFVNMSSDPEQEYFSDGISEEIINMLAQVPKLKVMGRTSSFAFKGKNMDLKLIGKQLDVGYLLEGSVRKSGNKLRITAQLINVTDGSHMYSEKFDRELEDIFDIQDEISLKILDAIKIRLLGKTKDAVLRNYTENVKAYELFLKGRYHFNKLTPIDFTKAIDYYQLAIAVDPTYAIAYAWLATCYWDAHFFKWLPKEQSAPLAIAAANKAIELDDQNAESLIAFGRLKMWSEWNFTEALELLGKGNRINPNIVDGNRQLAIVNIFNGNYEKGYAYIKKAHELDPFSLLNLSLLSNYYYFTSDYEKILEIGNRLIEMEPNFHDGHIKVGMALLSQKQNEEAITEIELAVKLTGERDILSLSYLGYGYGIVGEKSKAQEILQKIKALPIGEDEKVFYYGFVYYALEDWDQSMEFFHQAVNDRHTIMLFIKSLSQTFHPEMMDDPRAKLLFDSIDSKII